MNGNRWWCLALATLVFLGPLTHAGWSDQAGYRDQAVYPEPPSAGEATALAVAGDVLFTTPGKFITCVGSIALWTITMAVTLGTQYGDAAKLVIGGCGGDWVATGRDIQQAVVQPER
jgi:hypothetical protein